MKLLHQERLELKKKINVINFMPSRIDKKKDIKWVIMQNQIAMVEKKN